MAVYDRIFDGEDSEIRAFIAYVLYERARREWAEEFQRERNGAPGEIEQRAYDATWTPQLIQNARNSADSILAEYADSAVTAARPAIVEEALKGQAWKSVLLSMAANLAYTILLLSIVIALKFMGVDLISALQSIGAGQ